MREGEQVVAARREQVPGRMQHEEVALLRVVGAPDRAVSTSRRSHPGTGTGASRPSGPRNASDASTVTPGSPAAGSVYSTHAGSS